MENNQTPPAYKLPPPLPPLSSTDRPKKNSPKAKHHHQLTEKQKSTRRVVRYVALGFVTIIVVGTIVSVIKGNSNNPSTSSDTTSLRPPIVETVPDNNQSVEQEVATDNGNEQAWQAVLSTDFRAYREEDDVPGQVERYRDDIGNRLITISWGRSIYSDNEDTAIAEALSLVFNERHNVIRTKDTLFISTGVQEIADKENEYFYIIYCPKFLQSYSLYSKQSDSLFSTYSERLLEAVRTMKASN